jgi:DNA primase
MVVLLRYVNSPSTEIYDKSRSLYGIYFAKNEISRQDKCILVEGYLDVLSMHQLGITNVVASSGTSLTVEQIRLIRKFTNNVTIIYDGDSAGIKAALRGIDLVLKEGLNVKVVLLPEGQDPDDFARRHTLDEVNDHIRQNEQDFISFKADLLLGEAGGDPLKRASLINDVADTIALIPDAVIRAVYVRTCAGKFEIDEQILADRVNGSRTAMITGEQEQKRREAERMARREAAETAVPMGPDVEVPPPPVPDEYLPAEDAGLYMNEPSLAPCEREILTFILEEGCTPLEFDRDSKYYIEGEIINVAEFIDGIMADDDTEFANEPYRLVYEEYFRMYDGGLAQEQIQTRLLNSMDETIASVAKDILIEKYQITVKNYEDSLTAVTTRLVQFVPRALLAYQSRKVELILKDLTARLTSETDEMKQMEILSKISDYSKARIRLNNELGRV